MLGSGAQCHRKAPILLTVAGHYRHIQGLPLSSNVVAGLRPWESMFHSRRLTVGIQSLRGGGDGRENSPVTLVPQNSAQGLQGSGSWDKRQ